MLDKETASRVGFVGHAGLLLRMKHMYMKREICFFSFPRTISKPVHGSNSSDVTFAYSMRSDALATGHYFAKR